VPLDLISAILGDPSTFQSIAILASGLDEHHHDLSTSHIFSSYSRGPLFARFDHICHQRDPSARHWTPPSCAFTPLMAPSTFASAAAGNNQNPISARDGSSEWYVSTVDTPPEIFERSV
jgi:hypothetical protein